CNERYFKKNKLLKTALFLSLCSTLTFATEWDFLTVNGYGTLGGAYQDNDDVLYRDSLYADKGSQGEFSFANYSVLGLQLDAKATDALSFTVQGIASPNNGNDKLLDIEWANAKYQLSDSLDIRAGLMRLPTFMFSDILHVAYSYDMIRLPDMYGLVAINRYKGVELSHRLDINDVSLSSTLLYGETKNSVKEIGRDNTISKTDIDADKIYGVALKFLYNDLTLRTSYIQADVGLDNEALDGAFAQFNAIGIPVISEAIQKYQVKDAPVSFFNFAARYDFENSYLQGEYIGVESDSFLPDISSWNIAMGYNYERWTPFVAYSNTKGSSNYSSISAEGMPPQVAGAITGANQAFSTMSEGWNGLDVERISVGFRYDLYDNVALKFQYDEQKSKNDLQIFSTAMNFVF
ncbi:MAG: hypothetical protein K0U38_02295, partial [Epsilonproteobacteria bacterium]|nr:hypothetical protein [Campylobacterota bacterium]